MLRRSQVVEAWHTVKWAWLAIIVAYVVLQTIALRRLSGELKERSHRVWGALLAVFMVVWSVQMVFQDQKLDIVAELIFGALCLGGIAVLGNALLEQKRAVRDRSQGTTFC
jgi:hypothetical protein